MMIIFSYWLYPFFDVLFRCSWYNWYKTTTKMCWQWLPKMLCNFDFFPLFRIKLLAFIFNLKENYNSFYRFRYIRYWSSIWRGQRSLSIFYCEWQRLSTRIGQHCSWWYRSCRLHPNHNFTITFRWCRNFIYRSFAGLYCTSGWYLFSLWNLL